MKLTFIILTFLPSTSHNMLQIDYFPPKQYTLLPTILVCLPEQNLTITIKAYLTCELPFLFSILKATLSEKHTFSLFQIHVWYMI